MKLYHLFIISTILIFLSNFAISKEISKNKVPKAIIQSFEKEHSNAKNVRYDLGNEGNKKIYQISFEKDGNYYGAQYKADGKQIQLEEAVSPGELIDPIIAHLMKNYVKFSIIKSTKIYRNKILYGYDVALDLGKKSVELEFDKDGNFLKQY
jgi:hypothetical protein